MSEIKKKTLMLLRLALSIILILILSVNTTYGLQGTQSHENVFIGDSEPEESKPPKPPPDNRVSVKVTKVWESTSNKQGDRTVNHPESVSVQLFRNGASSGSPVTLSKSNNWTYVWRGLAADNTWTVDEISVPEGYEKTITGSSSKGFVITNTIADDPEEPEDPETSDPPETSKPPVETNTPGNREPQGQTTPTSELPSLNVPGASSEPDEILNTVEPPAEEDDGHHIDDPGIPGGGRDAAPDYSNFEIPKTGDDADARPWLIIMAVCALTLRYVLFFKKRVDMKNEPENEDQ